MITLTTPTCNGGDSYIIVTSSSSSSVIIVQLAAIQCVAPLAASNLQSGLSSASSVASSTLRLGTAVRILLASADSSILAMWPECQIASGAFSESCLLILNLLLLGHTSPFTTIDSILIRAFNRYDFH